MEFVNQVFNLVSNDYTVVGNYINSTSKILIKHNNSPCRNYTFEMTPNNFLNGQRCPSCFGNKKKNLRQFIKEVNELVGNEYSVLGEYKNNRTKILMMHDKCNTKYLVTPDKFLIGRRCPECYKNKRKSTDHFKKEVLELVGEEYSVIGEYKNAYTYIKMKHSVCENEYEVSPDAFLRGNRCPKCKIPRSEKKITTLLNEHGVEYIPQFRFDDCKNKKPLPFDFVVLDQDREISYAIEYDGEGHFRPLLGLGNHEEMNVSFKNTQTNDKIKNKYCKDNDIPLYRIPYWKKGEIENILYKLINNIQVEVDKTSFFVI